VDWPWPPWTWSARWSTVGGTLAGGCTCSAGVGTLLLVVVLLVWPEETLNVVRVLAAVLLILWGASTLGEAYGSPIRDNAYRRELDQEVRRLI
jgi:hypothetical protein